MSIIIEALRAAIDMISIDRQSFADCNARPDGSIDPGDETILREYDDVLDKLRAALAEHTSMAEEIERLRAEANTPTIFWGDDWNAARIMQTVIQKGHDYVLIVEPRDGGSRFQIHNRLRDIEVARMLERFARAAREDARFGGDE